jgi:hypothetical protein
MLPSVTLKPLRFRTGTGPARTRWTACRPRVMRRGTQIAGALRQLQSVRLVAGLSATKAARDLLVQEGSWRG